MSLKKYNTKRNFEETSEPSGKAAKKKDDELIFVVQRHKASRLHYDFRLELNGVLLSWAVPKGPSLNPADKRLAMMVEDHPYDYKDFEGVIPAGNYGAGIVEIWDNGTYDAIDEKGSVRIVTDYAKKVKLLKAGLEAGNLKFRLKGKKLKGEFALVKLKGNEDNSWLLIKHRDDFATDEEYNSEEYTAKNSPINKWLAENKPGKVAGRTKKAASKEAQKEDKPEEVVVKKKALTSKAATGKKLADFIPAMLAKDGGKPFSSEEWLYEIKWDGYRAIAELKGKEVKLYSRHGNSYNNGYPEVVEALEKLKLNAVLDGEVVVLNESGQPDFQKLQQYSINRNYPIIYYVFDLLELDGEKLYSQPLIERKKLLEELLKPNDIIKYSDHIEEEGEQFFEAIVEKNMEGIMAKRKSSLYYPGKRSSDWLKVKHHKTEEAIICGFTSPRGGRKHFGALILGAYVNGRLTYIGHTGSGFDDTLLRDISAKLKLLTRDSSPFDEKVKTNMPVTWVVPKYVCEVKYSEWTSDGMLRHPIFLRLRDDKDVSEVDFSGNGKLKMENGKLEEDDGEGEIENDETEIESGKSKIGSMKKVKSQKSKVKKAGVKKIASGEKDVVKNENERTYEFGKVKVKTTNRTKLYFPNDGVTKGEVIDYYEEMAELILPHIKDRPQSLFRTPNGITNQGFFQKDAGDEAPSWFKKIKLYSDSVKKDIHYLLCNDKPSLLYLANLGCIEINPWHSRVKSLDEPDYLIIDIDPSDNNTFDQVIEAAQAVKEVLDKAEAFSICKTSGASGLHIYVPLGAQYDYEHAKDFANLVCMMASQLIPGFTTLERNLQKRSKDKIYMDYLQNRRGQTIACVYSLRPKEGATVSTPLEWSEVKKGLHPKEFNIHTIASRLKKVGDLFKPMLDAKNAVDIEECLGKLSQ